VIDRLIFIQIF